MIQSPLVSNACHPLIGHSLIILLLASPILVFVALGSSADKRQMFLGSALAVMLVGTATTFAAFATGEAAAKPARFTPELEEALEQHRALAQTTRAMFSVLTLGFAALFFAPKALGRRLECRAFTALLAIYLTFYATGALFLIHTALQGGRLGHRILPRLTVTHSLLEKGGVR